MIHWRDALCIPLAVDGASGRVWGSHVRFADAWPRFTPFRGLHLCCSRLKKPLASHPVSVPKAVCPLWLRPEVFTTAVMSFPGAALLSASMQALPLDAKVRLDPARNIVRSVEGTNLLQSSPEIAALSSRDPAAAAVAFVGKYQEAFRLRSPETELKSTGVERDQLGFCHVRLAQMFRSLEVAQCEMRFHFNREGALYLISATHIPTPQLGSVQPSLDQPAAIRAAATALAAPAGDWPATLKIWASPDGQAFLAYEVAAAVGPASAWRVFVDAQSGKILQRISMIHSAPPPIVQ